MWRRLFIGWLMFWASGSAIAHPLLQNAMWVVFEPERARVAVNVSLREIIVAQQLKADTSGGLDTAVAAHGSYLVQHLSLRLGGRELPGRVVNVTPPVLFGSEPEQTFYQYELEYPFGPGSSRPATITFLQTMLREFPYAPGQKWDVTYVVRLKRDDEPAVSSGVLNSAESQTFATGWNESATNSANRTSSFAAYFRHGVMHILTGWDHLLFVSALVLATATFWELFKVIAAFTLAHTITLATSVLTGFRLPDSIVEPLIAGSIIFVAVQNCFFPRRTRGAARLAVAFAFGLVHGLGFAGGLRDAMGELGTVAVVAALLAFSLGVECGHQMVVLPLFGMLRLGDRQWETSFRAGALRYGSAVIAIAGGYYFVHALPV
jgi:hypothetical protein